MESHIKQRLKEEVLYLHSLWRGGPAPPPTTHFGPQSPHPIQALNPQNPTRISQQSRPEKKRKRKREKPKMVVESGIEARKQKDANLEVVDVEGGVSGSEWPPFAVKENVKRELTVEEQAVMRARKLHEKGIEACKTFFVENEGSDDEEEESGDEDCDEFRFFKKLFEEDEGLRGYYLENWGNGEFSCLVCRGSMEKVCKKFRNVVGVVQHSVTVSKTGRRRAHRAYGRVVCELLNWDIKKLPADSVVVVGENSGVKLVESGSGEKGLDVNWLRKERPDRASESGWGRFLGDCDAVVAKELTEEERIKVAATQLQHKSREAMRLFFSQNDVEEGDDDDLVGEVESDGSEVDEPEGGEKLDGCDEYKFLMKLFEDDEELCGYYARSWNDGAFFCLVCWGIVEKVNKRYKDCVALVQHCVSISKTKRRKAHRAYGKVICDLLSWDMNKLPANELPVGDALGSTSGVVPAEEPNLVTKCEQDGSEQTVKNSSFELPHEKPETTNKISTDLLGWAPFEERSEPANKASTSIASPVEDHLGTDLVNSQGDGMENGGNKDAGAQEAPAN